MRLKFFDGKIRSNHGNPIHIILGSKVRPNGRVDLKPISKENTDDFIQSFAESTDISFILAKLAQGDTTVINRNKPMFGDFTSIPQTFAEILQMHIDSDNMFDSLPVDVKAKFSNDKNQFFALAGTDKWFENLGYTKSNQDIPDVKPDVKPEVKE